MLDGMNSVTFRCGIKSTVCDSIPANYGKSFDLSGPIAITDF